MTRRVGLLISLCLVLPWSGLAQPPNLPPPPPEGPIDTSRLRSICAQLKLDAKQMQQAEALLDVYVTELEEVAKDHGAAVLGKIQEILAQIDVEEQKGNTQRVAELRQQLMETTPETAAENSFFRDLSQVLTEEQRAKVPALRKQEPVRPPSPPPPPPPPPPTTTAPASPPKPPAPVEPPTATRPAGPTPTQPARPPTPATPTPPAPAGPELRPAHVLMAAREFLKTAESLRKLEAVMDEYRSSVRTAPRDAAASAEGVDRLVQNVRAIMPPEKEAAFGERIEALRAAPPPAQPWAPAGPATPAAPAMAPGGPTPAPGMAPAGPAPAPAMRPAGPTTAPAMPRQP